MVTPKIAYFIRMFFNKKCILGRFKLLNCLDISILESLDFFLF